MAIGCRFIEARGGRCKRTQKTRAEVTLGKL